MSTILITGASGLIGKALAKFLSERHNVLCMSRNNPQLGLQFIKADFASHEALQQLNGHKIDVCVHLAAVTGGCSERDAILVNVEGTRVLMRYLIDHGCKKFVMASSIAVVGFQDKAFRPLQLPIPDEHPCLDRHGYGLSKYLMEEVTRYYGIQNPGIDVINLRLASVPPDVSKNPLKKKCSIPMWHLGHITQMSLNDAVRVFSMAAEAPHKLGVRIMNATGPRAWVEDTVANVLGEWYGDSVDLSYFKQPGHEYDSVFDASRIEKELGFVAQDTPEVFFPKR